MADLIERDALEAKIRENSMRIRFFDPSVNVILHLIRYAPAVNRWIPCSERMPNEAGEYLVCGKWNGEKSKTWICKFIIFGDIGGFLNTAKNPPISFWMPMPDAYEPPEKE